MTHPSCQGHTLFFYDPPRNFQGTHTHTHTSSGGGALDSLNLHSFSLTSCLAMGQEVKANLRNWTRMVQNKLTGPITLPPSLYPK